MDAHTVTVQLSGLTEHLGCVLCKGLLRHAQTLPECMHSFCKSCIYRHFVVKGRSYCPQCNTELKPRPITTLISDQQLQDIVDRIFPEFKEQEVELRKQFYEQHGFNKKPEVALAAMRASAEAAKATASASGPAGAKTPSRSVMIEVRPFKDTKLETPLPELAHPFLHVDESFKMVNLQKAIRKQLKLEDQAEIEISCLGATVGPELSVLFIQRTIWHRQRPNAHLELQYRCIG